MASAFRDITAVCIFSNCKEKSSHQPSLLATVFSTGFEPLESLLCHDQFFDWRKSSEEEEERGRNVRGVRGCLSLAIVWTQFLSRCIDHRQGVAEGGHAGNMREGVVENIRVVMDTRGRLERIAYFLCMWTANRKAGGPWRELQKEKELGWVGFCPCSLEFCSQPCSCAR